MLEEILRQKERAGRRPLWQPFSREKVRISRRTPKIYVNKIH